MISGIIVHPNWHEVIRQTLFPHFSRSNAYLLMIVAVIGTTISPWMQFYIQAAVVEKGIRAPQYPASRASVLFAIGPLNAALFTASILPLYTAYYVREAFGFERGIDRHFRDAKTFYGLYAALIFIGAGAVLNGALLPIVLVLMLLLVNNKRLMGNWTNTPILNGVAWATVAVVSALTAVSTVQAIFSSG